MNFNVIDMQNYERVEHYAHYANSNPCTYSVSARLDVSKLVPKIKSGGFKFYPTFIFLVTGAVNAVKELRMALDEDGLLGFYSEISASYLIFHEDDRTFSSCYTEYKKDFREFYMAVCSDMERYKDTKGFTALPSPKNSFPVSCIPWLNFAAINLNMPYAPNFYAPIITWGKYSAENGKIEMPIALQVNHAVCDGYHASLFFNELQILIDNFTA